MSSPESSPTPLMADQYLTFLIASEEYGVAILKVREVLEYDIVTHVPNTPGWIRGVINVRGRVLPVVDLAVKFGLPPSIPSKLSCIVVTEVVAGEDRLTMGVLADSVSQVIEFTCHQVEAPPMFGTRVKIEYLLGMGRLGKKFCQILDIDKVLSAEEVIAAANSVELAQIAEPSTLTREA